MAIRPITGILKSLELPEGAEERQGRDMEERRPRNMPPNTSPTEGFSLEVDGKIKSQHPTFEAATTTGAELKRNFPMLQVAVYDVVATTRTPVEAVK